MNKLNQLSREEMKKVMGGTGQTACETYANNNYTYPDALTCFNCSLPSDLDTYEQDVKSIVLDIVAGNCGL